jgi:hypothetical protein
MDKFDDRYILLQSMYEDSFFPQYLTDKLKWQLIRLIEFLETDERDKNILQEKFDEFTLFVNSLQQEFADHDSELDTVARESIIASLDYILHWFKIDIPVETAVREREW